MNRPAAHRLTHINRASLCCSLSLFLSLSLSLSHLVIRKLAAHCFLGEERKEEKEQKRESLTSPKTDESSPARDMTCSNPTRHALTHVGSSRTHSRLDFCSALVADRYGTHDFCARGGKVCKQVHIFGGASTLDRPMMDSLPLYSKACNNGNILSVTPYGTRKSVVSIILTDSPQTHARCDCD